MITLERGNPHCLCSNTCGAQACRHVCSPWQGLLQKARGCLSVCLSGAKLQLLSQLPEDAPDVEGELRGKAAAGQLSWHAAAGKTLAAILHLPPNVQSCSPQSWM